MQVLKTGGELHTAENFNCHCRPIMLSIQERVVLSRIPKKWATHLWCRRLHAISNPEFLICTWGFSQETKPLNTSERKYALQINYVRRMGPERTSQHWYAYSGYRELCMSPVE